MPLIIKGRKRVEKKKFLEDYPEFRPESAPEPKFHECGVCHHMWLCALSKCEEPQIPEFTECRKCKCGLPQCFLMESE